MWCCLIRNFDNVFSTANTKAFNRDFKSSIIDVSKPSPMKELQTLFFSMMTLVFIVSSCEENSTSKNETPGETIEKYYDFVLAEEYKKAAEMFSNKGRTLSLEEAKKIEDMITWAANDYKKKSGIKEVIIIEETIIGDYVTAKVKYNIVFNNDDEDDKKQALVKIDGKWYLKMITL